MEEKVLVKGQFLDFKTMLYLLLIIAVSLFIFSIMIGGENFSDYITDFDDGLVVSLPFYLSIIFLIAAPICYYLIKDSEITITDKRIYGKTKFGCRVDLPLNQISSVGQGLFKSLAVATSSGVIRFWLLENREEAFQEISMLLFKLQENTSSTAMQSNIPQSNADELKKFKDLLDSGIITQEEFEVKKKQILGL